MPVVADALDLIFLVAFLTGLLLTVLGGLGGHGHGAWHLPVPHPHGAAGAHGHVLGAHAGDGNAVGSLNVLSLFAGAAWFGGVGFLSRNAFGAPAVVSVALGVVAGLLIGTLVYWFLARVLVPAGRVLDPEDYRIPGTVARVSAPISPGRVGEIVYERDGTRCGLPARGVGERAIPRGDEVVVLRVERGIASVESWAALLNEERDAGGEVRTTGAPSVGSSAAPASV